MTRVVYSDRGSDVAGSLRTVLGDLVDLPQGVFYAHEHLLIDAPLIAAVFPHIHLDDVGAAVDEVADAMSHGVAAIVDAMPASSGRDVLGLAEISRRTGVPVIASTGLHHDRYYGPRHWSNNVDVDTLARLMVEDLEEGIDVFDYTSPVVRRSEHRAGLIKVATSGPHLDARDRRNLRAAGVASAATGSPVLTHCEGGLGALEQIECLAAEGVPASAVILSHVDKTGDLEYLSDLAATGAVLELDQALRQRDDGADAVSIRLLAGLVSRGYEDQVVVGADAARRSLWRTLSGGPGMSWLGRELPGLLARAGLDEAQTIKIMRTNAQRAYTWRAVA